jgi:hypothetical protein
VKSWTKSVAIIGSGPSSFIAAKRLIQFGYKPTIFIIPEDESLLKNRKGSIGIQIRKDLPGSRLFDQSHRFMPEIQQESTNITETFATGGLGNIWGGVCFPDSREEMSKLGITHQQYLDYTEYLVSELQINNFDSPIWKEFTTPSKNSLMLDIPSLAKKEDNTAWNPRDEWDKLVELGAEIVWGFVENCKESPLNVRVEYRDACERLTLRDFDYVIAAMGPFGNARLLLKLNPIMKKIEIKDSAVEYRIVLTRKFKKTFTDEFPERCMKLNAYIDDGIESIQVYAQFYQLTNKKLSFVSPWYFRFLVAPFWNLVRHFAEIALVMYSQDCSDSINFSISEEGQLSSSRVPANSDKKIARKLFRKSLSRVNRIYLPIKLLGAPGTSVHSGAFVKSTPTITDLGGMVTGASKIQFVGASSLSRVPVGPITFSALMQTLFTVDRIIEA